MPKVSANESKENEDSAKVPQCAHARHHSSRCPWKRFPARASSGHPGAQAGSGAAHVLVLARQVWLPAQSCVPQMQPAALTAVASVSAHSEEPRPRVTTFARSTSVALSVFSALPHVPTTSTPVRCPSVTAAHRSCPAVQISTQAHFSGSASPAGHPIAAAHEESRTLGTFVRLCGTDDASANARTSPLTPTALGATNRNRRSL